ncbi:MAG: hypothetical protein HY879_10095 [Deltaproteobacteria bacterium]|nr:hypothetical protein [Deltaproteobacteria bacterium]
MDKVQNQGDRDLGKNPPICSIALCLALCLMAGILFTWPMVNNFFSAIPFMLFPAPEFARVPLMPGDHLQTYYWFWLLSDNLWGLSHLFTNPYEFNGPAGPMSAVYANFPFSLLYILLLPLGPVGAYNGLILLSFLFSGLAMFLLAWTWTRDSWASLLAGLVFAVVPYRVSHIAGGQLFGYVIFLLPLCLYFMEKTLKTGRWVYGGAAGFCLVLLSLMEPHASFLAALTIGVYLPNRILLFQTVSSAQKQEEEVKPLWPGLLGALTGGLSIASFLWMQFVKKSGFPLWHFNWIQLLILGGIAALLLWFYLSALVSRWTGLPFAEARHRVGKAFFLFLPLWLYVLKFQVDITRLGMILPLFCLGLFASFLTAQWIKRRKPLFLFDRSGIVPVIVGVGVGLALAAAYLIHMRATVFLPSIAGKGRTIREVLLFSPKIGNFFSLPFPYNEKYIFLGRVLLLLAVCGLIPLFKSRPKNPGFIALAGLLAFLALILTLGPTMPYFPLYQFFYEYLPFFNYPRVPARFVMIGFIFLGLLAASAMTGLRAWLASRGWGRWRIGITLLIILLVSVEYHTGHSLGLSLMKGDNRLYEEIKRHLPKGRVVLELPIWPGDSHQSSVYEYTVTRTQRPMINGYAPVVARDYINQVFWPLYPLNHGELTLPRVREMQRLKVGLLTFHDNPYLYSEKVSPFPRRLALKRLAASPWLKLIDHDEDVYLFKLAEKADGYFNSSAITSPVQSIVYSNNLTRKTGRYQFDPFASGYNFLFEEESLTQGKPVLRPGMRGGNVVSAIPGQDLPGYLILGPNRFYPSGKFRARFRIKAGSVDPQKEIGRIEIIEQGTKIIAQKSLFGRDMQPFQTWMDIPLEFEIPESSRIGFRIYFSGEAPLYYNLAVIGFADQKKGPGLIEAEELFRPTGVIVSDPLASGREALFGKAVFKPSNFLCYGPFRTFEPGSYQARFFLRLKSLPGIPGDSEIAVLDLCTDAGRRILGSRKLKVQDLKADAYTPVVVDFKVPFRLEIESRVLFLEKEDLLVDRIEITALP